MEREGFSRASGHRLGLRLDERVMQQPDALVQPVAVDHPGDAERRVAIAAAGIPCAESAVEPRRTFSNDADARADHAQGAEGVADAPLRQSAPRGVAQARPSWRFSRETTARGDCRRCGAACRRRGARRAPRGYRRRRVRLEDERPTAGDADHGAGRGEWRRTTVRRRTGRRPAAATGSRGVNRDALLFRELHRCVQHLRAGLGSSASPRDSVDAARRGVRADRPCRRRRRRADPQARAERGGHGHGGCRCRGRASSPAPMTPW